MPSAAARKAAQQQAQVAAMHADLRARRGSAATVTLSRNQADVMRTLLSVEAQQLPPPSGPDIARILGQFFSSWADVRLKALERKGLIRQVGHAETGSRTWASTERGRQCCKPTA